MRYLYIIVREVSIFSFPILKKIRNKVYQKYFKAEKDAVDQDGWFDTGDISVLDGDGYMIIKDRAKDVIKSGG